jgi:hypothetical protein
MTSIRSAWEALVAYKNSPDYARRVTAAVAQKATLRSKWSAL